LTLVEVVVALAMFSLIALALESALMLATKAVPDAQSANASYVAGAKVNDQIASELFYAQSVTELTSRSITFTVADRDNDSVPETIRYAWSGTSGDPLTRQYNSNAAVNVLDNVQEFTLAYDKRAVKSPTTYTEGPEQQVYSSGKGLLGGGSIVDSANFVGEAIPAPSWSSDVVLWRVTRVRIVAQQSGTSGDVFRVQVRPQNGGGLPGSVVADQVAVAESSLPLFYSTFDIVFSGAPSLSPGDAVCVIFRYARGTTPLDVWCNNLSLALFSGTQLVSTSNGGASWSGNTLRAVAMTVWAAGSTKDADSYKYYLTDVRTLIRSGNDVAARVNGTLRVPCEPQVSGP
jgi:hypothetical protein